MLYREIIAVCYEILVKYINVLFGQNIKCFNVKPGGTQSYHRDLQSQTHSDVNFSFFFFVISMVKAVF
jgi:hypothetical protein